MGNKIQYVFSGCIKNNRAAAMGCVLTVRFVSWTIVTRTRMISSISLLPITASVFLALIIFYKLLLQFAYLWGSSFSSSLLVIHSVPMDTTTTSGNRIEYIFAEILRAVPWSWSRYCCYVTYVQLELEVVNLLLERKLQVFKLVCHNCGSLLR